MTQAIPDPLGRGKPKGINFDGYFEAAQAQKDAEAAAAAALAVPAESSTFSVTTRDPSGMPPSSRLPTPFEGGTKRLGDPKKKQARKELLGD